eukprot:TRINITY_DN101633_c0_g1_i1.p1 TRINITY_DN101633_c0_g1~~TRINITY_DN101633_c0_g1_i1.p1  ORF type:complete len:244 (-),score=73.66 TRINITY_DN101633_c0_g1_i1:151-882(-)
MRALLSRCVGKVGESLPVASGGTPQLLILGLDQAGKTTLLYRLKMGHAWESSEMKAKLLEMRTPDTAGYVQDAGYHFEELSYPFAYGAWDVPGTQASRQLWGDFYKSIKTHAVIYVVFVSAEKPKPEEMSAIEERIQQSKKNLHLLLNEAELRRAAFCVILNQESPRRDQHHAAGKLRAKQDQAAELEYKLGLHDLHPSCAWRTKIFHMNILELTGESDATWKPVMEFVRQTLADKRSYELKL